MTWLYWIGLTVVSLALIPLSAQAAAGVFLAGIAGMIAYSAYQPR